MSRVHSDANSSEEHHAEEQDVRTPVGLSSPQIGDPHFYGADHDLKNGYDGVYSGRMDTFGGGKRARRRPPKKRSPTVYGGGSQGEVIKKGGGSAGSPRDDDAGSSSSSDVFLLGGAAGNVIDGYDSLDSSNRCSCATCMNYTGAATFLMLNIGYSLAAATLFAAFAIRRALRLEVKLVVKILLGTLYGASSWIINFPMALFFLEAMKKALQKFAQSVRILFSCCIKGAPKSEFSPLKTTFYEALFGTVDLPKSKLAKWEAAIYIAVFVPALVLAVLTVFAGFEVAIESVEIIPDSRVVIKAICIVASLINTLSTRFVGSVNLLYNASHLCLVSPFYAIRYIKGRRYRMLRTIATDIKAIAPALSDDLFLVSAWVGEQNDGDDAIFLANFTKFFYKQWGSHLNVLERMLKFSWDIPSPESIGGLPSRMLDVAKWALILMSAAVISVCFTLPMAPLFLMLTAKGLNTPLMKAIFKDWSSAPAFVAVVTSPNVLFYLQSGLLIMPSCIEMLGRLFSAPKTGIILKSIVKLVFWGSIFSGLALLEYFSSMGYVEDAAEFVDPAFFKNATNPLWPIVNKAGFSLVESGIGLVKSFYAMAIVAIDVGLIVNGGAFLRFLLSENVQKIKSSPKCCKEKNSAKVNFLAAAKRAGKILDKMRGTEGLEALGVPSEFTNSGYTNNTTKVAEKFLWKVRDCRSNIEDTESYSGRCGALLKWFRGGPRSEEQQPILMEMDDQEGKSNVSAGS